MKSKEEWKCERRESELKTLNHIWKQCNLAVHRLVCVKNLEVMLTKCDSAIKALTAENAAKDAEIEREHSAYIETLGERDGLEAKCIVLQADLARVTAELSEAIEALRGKCSACKHYTPYHRQGKCENCWHDNANPACLREYQEDNWEWRGPKEAD